MKFKFKTKTNDKDVKAFVDDCGDVCFNDGGQAAWIDGGGNFTTRLATFSMAMENSTVVKHLYAGDKITITL